MYRRYLVVFVVTLAAVLLLVGGFAQVVDPFACNEWVRQPGFNRDKTRLVTRIAKIMHVSCHDYDAMVFGTSRASFLPIDHPAWKGYRPYNFALAAASINETRLALAYTQRVHPLKRVAIGLDFFMFGAQPQLPESAAAFLSATRKARPNLVDYSLTLLAVSTAVETVWDNLDQSRGGILRAAHAGAADESGQDQLPEFRGQIWGFQKIYSKINFPPEVLSELTRIVEFSRKQGIELSLYINPQHASILEVIRERGWWDAYENWKRSITRIAWRGGKDPVPLYDFSGYNAYTTEPVPTAENGYRRMQWYVDSSHFQYAVGARILDRLFGADNGEAPRVPGFGVRLRPDTVERDLAEIREQREAWLATNPPELAWVRELGQQLPAN